MDCIQNTFFKRWTAYKTYRLRDGLHTEQFFFFLKRWIVYYCSHCIVVGQTVFHKAGQTRWYVHSSVY